MSDDIPVWQCFNCCETGSGPWQEHVCIPSWQRLKELNELKAKISGLVVDWEEHCKDTCNTAVKPKITDDQRQAAEAFASYQMSQISQLKQLLEDGSE